MQAQVSSTQAVTGSRMPAVRALGGTALALVVAAGVGLWQGTGQHSQRTASTSASQQVASLAVEPVASGHAFVATPQEIVAATGVEAPIVYIAGSEEEADFLRRFAAEVDALHVEAGHPARSVSVVVAASADDAAQLMEQMAQVREMQHNIGLPMSLVFDLRAR